MSSAKPMFSKLFHRVWQSSVGWSFAVTALRAGGFLLVLPLALRSLTPAEMGLWYLFTSIGELCSFAELGLGPIIGRTASFFLAGVPEVPRTGLSVDRPVLKGAGPNLAGLSGLLGLARRVYFRIALGVIGFMGTIGAWIVVAKVRPLPGAHGEEYAAYAVFTAASGLAILGLYWPQFLNGLGNVRHAQRALLAGLVANYAVAATGLLLGAGTMSLALGQLALAAVTFALARGLTLAKHPELRGAAPQPIAIADLWPSTWRSLAISFGSYCSNYGTTLVCGIVTDLATTASFGLSFRLAAVVHGLSAVWFNVRLPGISTARAARDRDSAIHLARSALPRCLATYAAGAAGILLAGPWALELLHSRTPLLPLPLLGALLLMLGLDFIVGFHSAIIQTANRFPHLRVYLFSGILTLALAFALGRTFGVAGILAAPLLAQSAVTYWWIPVRCWRELRE